MDYLSTQTQAIFYGGNQVEYKLQYSWDIQMCIEDWIIELCSKHSEKWRSVWVNWKWVIISETNCTISLPSKHLSLWQVSSQCNTALYFTGTKLSPEFFSVRFRPIDSSTEFTQNSLGIIFLIENNKTIKEKFKLKTFLYSFACRETNQSRILDWLTQWELGIRKHFYTWNSL